MIDPDLKSSLNEINTNLTEIKNKRFPGIWRAFFHGMFTALGYVAGLALVIIFLSWFLNKIGVLPEFKKQVHDFQAFMNSAQRVMSGANTNQPSQNGEGSYMITLPDGRKAEVTPQQ